MAHITREMREKELEEDRAYHEGLERRLQERAEAMKEVHLTRRIILDGTRYTEKVPIPGAGYINVRPLNDREYGQVQRSVLQGLTSEELNKLNQDIAKAQELNQRSQYLAVSMAIVDEEAWTPEDVGNLPAGAPEIIYGVVAKISGFPQASRAPGGRQ